MAIAELSVRFGRLDMAVRVDCWVTADGVILHGDVLCEERSDSHVGVLCSSMWEDILLLLSLSTTAVFVSQHSVVVVIMATELIMGVRVFHNVVIIVSARSWLLRKGHVGAFRCGCDSDVVL